MPSAVSNTEEIDAALLEARAAYAKSNLKSQEINRESLLNLPGGRGTFPSRNYFN
jgi:hypothetical protein